MREGRLELFLLEAAGAAGVVLRFLGHAPAPRAAQRGLHVLLRILLRLEGRAVRARDGTESARARQKSKSACLQKCPALNKVQLDSNVHPFDDQNLKPGAFNFP